MKHITAILSCVGLLECASAGGLREPVAAMSICETADDSYTATAQDVVIVGRPVFGPHDIRMVSNECPDREVVLNTDQSCLLDASRCASAIEKAQVERLNGILEKHSKETDQLELVLGGVVENVGWVGYVVDKDGAVLRRQGFGTPAPYSKYGFVVKEIIEVKKRCDLPKIPLVRLGAPELRSE